MDDNPLDAVWSERPPPPSGAVVLHDLRYAGEDAAEKLARVRGATEKPAADALVVSDPQAVSWLFNIRGSDVAHTPVALGFAIVPREGRPALYLDGRKLGNDVRQRLEELAARARRDGVRTRSCRRSAAKSMRCGSTLPPARMRSRAS